MWQVAALAPGLLRFNICLHEGHLVVQRRVAILVGLRAAVSALVAVAYGCPHQSYPEDELNNTDSSNSGACLSGWKRNFKDFNPAYQLNDCRWNLPQTLPQAACPSLTGSCRSPCSSWPAQDCPGSTAMAPPRPAAHLADLLKSLHLFQQEPCPLADILSTPLFVFKSPVSISKTEG